MNKTESKLKGAVKDLFSGGKVDLVIGYENGTLPLRNRPCFVRSADEADRLVWDSFCVNNLAVYLPRFFQMQEHKKEETRLPKVGIVAKGCDVRSVVGLVKEKQIPRENLVIIGVPCQGLIDLKKVETMLNGDSLSVCEENSEGTLHITTMKGAKKKIVKEQVTSDACLECRYPLLEDVDVLIEGDTRESSKEKYANVKTFEAKSNEERWKYFEEEISKCIRCYACRHACSNCYCQVCFVEQTKPRWVGMSDDLSDIMLYHIGRIFHQAGRCVGCDACVRACPMGIDIRTFTQKLVKDVEELFDYIPGLSLEELPPLCTFKENDSQNFITEP